MNLQTKSQTKKTWYETTLETIAEKCPPEHYIALDLKNPKKFAVDKSAKDAVRKLREQGYSGNAHIHYQLRPDKTYIF